MQLHWRSNPDLAIGKPIGCTILPKITGMIPATFVDNSDWGIPEGLMLADENFNRPNAIDTLLGTDVIFEVLCHVKKMQPGNYAVLQDTEVGWIISGKIPLSVPEEVPRKSFFIRNNDNLDQQLQRFWKIEELPNKTWTAKEILCEEHFKKHTTWVEDTGSAEEWYYLPHHVVFKSSPAEFITKFSTLSRLHRILACCMRFSHNARNPSLRRTGYLTSTELRDALHTCIKIAQLEICAQEINDLCKTGQVSSKSQLQPLHPFRDSDSYLWVGGRLRFQTSTNFAPCTSSCKTDYNEWTFEASACGSIWDKGWQY